jgi:hypothetical protein
MSLEKDFARIAAGIELESPDPELFKPFDPPELGPITRLREAGETFWFRHGCQALGTVALGGALAAILVRPGTIGMASDALHSLGMRFTPLP